MRLPMNCPVVVIIARTARGRRLRALRNAALIVLTVTAFVVTR